MKEFNPKEHVIMIEKWDNRTKTYKTSSYLPTQWRIYWMRLEHPNWRIITKPPQILMKDGEIIGALVEATVVDENDKILSNGFSMIYASDFRRFVEKAETTAIGRALWKLGYGLGYGTEEEEEIEEQTQEEIDPQNTNFYSTLWSYIKKVGLRANEIEKILGTTNFSSVPSEKLNLFLAGLRDVAEGRMSIEELKGWKLK